MGEKLFAQPNAHKLKVHKVHSHEKSVGARKCLLASGSMSRTLAHFDKRSLTPSHVETAVIDEEFQRQTASIPIEVLASQQRARCP
mmetsp:Transcript_30625/g.46233  ORF Transcript_30625/g.46233 Transcript_30625/m.46233 type:complete len:86 (-) Transcript_30625:791-1048(-)